MPQWPERVHKNYQLEENTMPQWPAALRKNTFAAVACGAPKKYIYCTGLRRSNVMYNTTKLLWTATLPHVN